MLEMHFFVTSSLKHSCRVQQQVQNYRKCLKKQFFGESKLSFFCVESNSMNAKLYWHAAVTCFREGLRRKHVLCDGDGNRPTARANKEKASGPDWLARLRYGRDSNPRPPAWQAGILTSWTTTPLFGTTKIYLLSGICKRLAENVGIFLKNVGVALCMDVLPADYLQKNFTGVKAMPARWFRWASRLLPLQYLHC